MEYWFIKNIYLSFQATLRFARWVVILFVARKRYSIISLLDLWGRFETQNYITVNILRRLDAYRVFCFV